MVLLTLFSFGTFALAAFVVAPVWVRAKVETQVVSLVSFLVDLSAGPRDEGLGKRSSIKLRLWSYTGDGLSTVNNLSRSNTAAYCSNAN